MIAKVEKEHEERYLKLLKNIQEKKVFKKDEEVEWICRKCGHVHKGKEAPKTCPTCKHPQSYFELRAKNY
jgi:rubrerythrin